MKCLNCGTEVDQQGWCPKCENGEPLPVCSNSLLEEKIKMAKTRMAGRAGLYRKHGNTAFAMVIEEALAILEEEINSNKPHEARGE